MKVSMIRTALLMLFVLMMTYWGKYGNPYHLRKLKYWYKSFLRVLFMICSGI